MLRHHWDIDYGPVIDIPVVAKHREWVREAKKAQTIEGLCRLFLQITAGTGPVVRCYRAWRVLEAVLRFGEPGNAAPDSRRGAWEQCH